jgi:hypothetical protein
VSALLLLVLLSCRHAAAPDPALLSSPPAAAEIVPAGAVVDGVWEDARYPWTMRVPRGWEAVVGEEGHGPRLTIVHSESRARLEVSVRDDAAPGPRPRRGCAWTFESDGGYRAIPGAGPLRAATCSPDEAQDARLLGYFLVRGGRAWDFEVVAPPGALLEAKRQTDQVLSTVRFFSDAP